mgnify:FL=1
MEKRAIKTIQKLAIELEYCDVLKQEEVFDAIIEIIKKIRRRRNAEVSLALSIEDAEKLLLGKTGDNK